MSQDRPLPAGLRSLLRQALELVEEMRSPRLADEEEILLQLLDDLKSRVSDALLDARATDLPRKQEVVRSLRAADGILQPLTDPMQRDARGRLRDVAAHLRDALG